jgi:hypothetical protein
VSDEGPGLERGAGGDSLQRKVMGDLERILSEGMLERVDSSQSLSRDLQATTEQRLTHADLDKALERADDALPTLEDLEGMLELGEGFDLPGLTLKDLLDDRAGSMKVLNQGLTFLKHQRYAEALDWWRLQREKLDPKSSRLHLLLTIMEALTYHLAGDGPRSAAARRKIQSHPLRARLGRKQ